MVIIRTSAVEVSIQAVSPLSSFGPAAAGVWAIADRLQAETNAVAQNRRRTSRWAKLIPDLSETRRDAPVMRRREAEPRFPARRPPTNAYASSYSPSTPIA